MATTNNNQPKQPTMYNAMYAAIKEQAQSPAQVVKHFYDAAMLLEDGRYKQIFEEVVYKDIKPIINEIKRHADCNKNIKSLQKEAKAVEALEKVAKAAKESK